MWDRIDLLASILEMGYNFVFTVYILLINFSFLLISL